MKFEIKNGAFLEIINYFSCVSRYSINKEFEGHDRVNIINNDNGLILSANNRRICLRASFNDLNFSGLGYKNIAQGEISVKISNLINAVSSFRQEGILTIELVNDAGGNTLKIINTLDVEEYQTIPCFDKLMLLVKESSAYIKDVDMSRYVFCKGMNNVKFSVGFEEDSKEYLHFVMRTSDKKVRFVAGTGGRFAINDFQSDNIITSNPSQNTFLFPKEHVFCIVKILESLPDEKIKIYQSDPKTGQYQMKLTCGDFTFMLCNMLPNIKWPDESAIFKLPYKHKAIVNIDDLKYAVSGVMATFDVNVLKKDNKPHIVSVKFDWKNKTLLLDANEISKSHRKVPIANFDSDLSDMNFKCCSAFLKEIVNSYNGKIQIECISEKKPIVVYINALDNVSKAEDISYKDGDIIEKMVIFFAPII